MRPHLTGSAETSSVDLPASAPPRRAPKVCPPRDEEELLARARALSGRTVGELAAERRVAVPPTAHRAKGLVGRLVEEALGATAGSKGRPDFEALGIELKTLPLDREGRPKESTFVCSIALTRMAETEWEESLVWRKLRRVLWMPVESDPALPLPARRLGTPILWSPSERERDRLRQDWEALAERIGSGGIDRVTAHLGEVLQVRPKAAHARVRRRAPEEDGAFVWALPRGFYLRTAFTRALVQQALAR